MIRVSILGATGYSGGELLRLLLNRSGVQLNHLTSESSSGQPISGAHPHLRGLTNLQFERLNIKKIIQDSDVVFSCYPHTIGINPNTAFYNAGLKVIDLSGDFRLLSAGLYKSWYKKNHDSPHLLKKAVYGLPELFRAQIRKTTLIANPGCYATAAILSAAPLLNPLRINPMDIIIDAKSGVSGAGKKLAPMYLFSEVDENLQAYSVASHRHQPEIEQTLKHVGGKSVQVVFTPHLVPMNRGILSVLYATLKVPMSLSQIRTHYASFYAKERFVRILPEGEMPQTKNVSYSNYCDIGISLDKRTRRVIVLSAIDNLVKGAAGQAIQNMNILFNRPETEGLL